MPELMATRQRKPKGKQARLKRLVSHLIRGYSCIEIGDLTTAENSKMVELVISLNRKLEAK